MISKPTHNWPLCNLEKMEALSEQSFSMILYSPLSAYAMGKDAYYYSKHVARSSRSQTARLLESIVNVLQENSGKRLSIIAPGLSGFHLLQGLIELSKENDIQPFINTLLLSSSFLPGSTLERSEDMPDSLSSLLGRFMFSSGHILLSRGMNKWSRLDKRLTRAFQCHKYGSSRRSWRCNSLYGEGRWWDYSGYPIGLYLSEGADLDPRIEDFPTSRTSSEDDLHQYRDLTDNRVISSLATHATRLDR